MAFMHLAYKFFQPNKAMIKGNIFVDIKPIRALRSARSPFQDVENAVWDTLFLNSVRKWQRLLSKLQGTIWEIKKKIAMLLHCDFNAAYP